MESTFLNGILPEDFLQTYWNKKPLLIKGAVKNTEEFATREDFIEMSKDEYFETRMVYEKGGEYPWQAKLGPFKDADFKDNALWTLICHNLELLNPDFFELKKQVRFIPDWNFDDVMATISKKGASVGAHIDDYSVFILQGSGTRKWMLEERANPEYVPNLDIKLLKTFKPDIEWVLEPGDMLYLPPNLAHHGVSLEDSISYSLGFKSIRYKDLLDFHANEILNKVDEESFHDPKTSLQRDPFILQDYVIENIYQDLLHSMADKTLFKKSLLKYLSRPKNAIENNREETESEIRKELKALTLFKRDMWSKIVANQITDKQFQISINLNLYTVTDSTYHKLQNIFLLDPEEEIKLIKSDLENKELIDLLTALIGEGVFYFL